MQMLARLRHFAPHAALLAIAACAALTVLAPVASAATVRGTSGANTLSGTPLADRILAREGADTIRAGAGSDFIHTGHDRVRDTVFCGRGDDTVLVRLTPSGRMIDALYSCEHVIRVSPVVSSNPPSAGPATPIATTTLAEGSTHADFERGAVSAMGSDASTLISQLGVDADLSDGHMLVAVFGGLRASAGYGMHVTSVTDGGSSITVHATLTRPGSGCATASVMTTPFALLSMTADTRPLSLELIEVPGAPCDS